MSLALEVSAGRRAMNCFTMVVFAVPGPPTSSDDCVSPPHMGFNALTPLTYGPSSRTWASQQQRTDVVSLLRVLQHRIV